MFVDPSSTKVLVTGAGGFISLHTILQLLQLGYKVRGTVRTESHGKNVGEVLSKHVETNKLEIVLADLMKDEGWREAVHGCGFVLHLASPYPAEEPKDENELIVPARDGTLRVLRAAQAEGVKRVVLASSVAAVTGGHEGENRNFDESDWTDLQKSHYAYQKSKTLAERSAWDFIHSAENKNKMQMAAVNPSNVFGPVLDNHHHTSTEWFRTLMRAEIPGVAHTQLDFVDVRDVVEMIVKAMTIPDATDRRFLANGASIPLPEFADILHRNFATRGYRVPTRVLPNLMIRFLALLIPKTRTVANALGWTYGLSTEQARSILGWQTRPYEQTIIEMAESMIGHRMV